MTHFFGHDEAERAFLRAYHGNRLHHAWLLAGPEGIGKASFARRVAGHVLTRERTEAVDALESDPGNVGSAMIAQGRHPDLHWLALGPKDDKEARKQEDGKPFEIARSIRIAQVRALQKRLNVRPSLSERRVIVIDPVDLLERSAANALLKSLEEPPANTLFLLIAHNPGRLLPTIRSRCLSLRFAPLSDDCMIDALRAARPDASDGELRALATLGQGAPGQALAYAGLDMAAVHDVLDRIVSSGDRDHRGRMALGTMVAGKAQQPRFQALLRLAPSFAAQQIKTMPSRAMPEGIAARQEMIALAGRSVLLNLDAQSVAFQIGGLLTRLTGPR